MVRHPTPGLGLDGSGHGGGAGAGPTHHRTMAVGLRRGRACGPDLRAGRWRPPALDEAQREELKEAVQQSPATSGVELANWYWKVVRQFVLERCGIELSRSSCLNYLHRLGFAFKRPKERLVKADEAKREAFLEEYAVRRDALAERYSSRAGPTSVLTRNCGASGR